MKPVDFLVSFFLALTAGMVALAVVNFADGRTGLAAYDVFVAFFGLVNLSCYLRRWIAAARSES